MLNVIFIKKNVYYTVEIDFWHEKGDFLPVNATLFYRKVIKI